MTTNRTRHIRTAMAGALAAGLVVGVLTGMPAGATTATPAAACVMPTSGGLATATTGGATDGHLDVLDDSAQVLPAHHLTGAPAATLCSARDAVADFQLEISADAGTSLGSVAVAAGNLVGPGGAVLPSSDVELDREAYTTLTQTSDGELDTLGRQTGADTVTPDGSRISRNEQTGTCTDTADACQIPDELIPDVDKIAHQKRNAFSQLTIPAGQNRTVWVDVFVPAATTAGTYTGALTVTHAGGKATSVPLSLAVVAATLPATSSVHSAFFYGVQGNTLADYQATAELGLDDRISVVPQGPLPSGGLHVLSALMNGTDANVQPTDATGAHGTLTDFPMNTDLASNGGDYQGSYRSLFTAGVKTTPWAYCDEWGAQFCASAYAADSWQGLPLLAIDAVAPFNDTADKWIDPNTRVVPAPLAGAVKGVVDLVQYLDPIGTFANIYGGKVGDRSPALRAWAASGAGNEAWTYTSNTSGSSWAANPQYTGAPSYGIDQIASEQRAMGWDLFDDGMSGELYWQVNHAPTNDGLVGDGQLFYPYSAALVGGQTPVPLESVRLKRIRDGRQDYELLSLASKQNLTSGTGQTASSIARALFPAVHQSAVAPATFDAAEQSLLDLFPLPANPGTTTTAKAVGSHDLNCDGNPDFVAVQAGSGNLLFYPRTATDWTPDAPIVEASGFGGTYQKLLLAGDLNGDGAPDLVGRKADGSLWLMAGNCTGKLAPAVAMGTSTTNPTAVGDFDGDGIPDLVDQHADGTLWLLAGTGKGTFAPAVQNGSGWSAFTITGVGDANGDGNNDILARSSSGTTLLYEGNGHGSWNAATVNGGLHVSVSLPVGTDPQVIGAGDLSGDGKVDLAVIDSAGHMIRYAGTGTGDFATSGPTIGNGWISSVLSQVAS